ncbi:MAG: L-aspartate oxidase [Peptococcaceae bacterium]|nr:L-aspartate oxidase [Peptococcaceae bacterium]
MQTNTLHADVLIAGSGAAGLFAALSLPEEWDVLIITKDTAERSDSFLAQGGICVLRDQNDYSSYYEDTLKAGHYENDPAAVHTMISSSRMVINQLLACGVPFEQQNGKLCYTREGAHSVPRILYHKDQTGKAITSCLLQIARNRSNITILEHTAIIDLLVQENCCYGAVIHQNETGFQVVTAHHTLLATGGIGGLYSHSTNYDHLTGDGIAIALRHNIALRNPDYVQIHPTSLYSTKPGRRFLISESVRGEGAVLLNAAGERFVDELQPRDVVAQAILKQMALDGTPYVHLSLQAMDKDMILHHFPTIYQHCLEEGYDITKELIPVVPAQHYFMGGIQIDLEGHTSMQHLYAAGETACNGVHGANRLASNSLLESLVFAQRAAVAMQSEPVQPDYQQKAQQAANALHPDIYQNLTQYQQQNRELVLNAIKNKKTEHKKGSQSYER